MKTRLPESQGLATTLGPPLAWQLSGNFFMGDNKMPEKGLCQCGCGEKTNIAECTRPDWGHVKDRPVRFLNGHNMRGEKHYNWSGGRIKNSCGYWDIMLPDHPRSDIKGYVREHIIVAEKALGKPLPEKAIVHHHNKIRGDNKTPGNLVVCQDRAYHQLLHQRMRAYAVCGHASWRKCTYCKQYDDPINLYVSHTSYHNKCRRKKGVIMELKVNNKVYWESQSAGYYSTKTGFVWEIVSPQEWLNVEDYPNHRVMFDGGARDHKSYLIEVRDGKTDKAKPKLYWPRVSQLRKVKE